MGFSRGQCKKVSDLRFSEFSVPLLSLGKVDFSILPEVNLARFQQFFPKGTKILSDWFQVYWIISHIAYNGSKFYPSYELPRLMATSIKAAYYSPIENLQEKSQCVCLLLKNLDITWRRRKLLEIVKIFCTGVDFFAFKPREVSWAVADSFRNISFLSWRKTWTVSTSTLVHKTTFG